MRKYRYRKDFTVNGRRYTVRADTKKELTEKEIQKRVRIETAPPVSSSMSLREWSVQCVETYKAHMREDTRKEFVRVIEKHILSHIGDMKLKDIKPIHCQRVINLQQGMSKTQIDSVYQAMNFLFKHATANELTPKNPVEGITRPTGLKGRRRALTAFERYHFIRVGYTDRRYYMFLLMILCGCRPGEAANVKGSDIVMVKGYPMLHIRGTKTANADRIVPIPDELYRVIKEIPQDEYIAVSQRGQIVTKTTKRRVWASYCRNINLSMGCKTYRNALVPPLPLAPDLVPYCLRHEYCTELARQGVDIRTAQKLMGHSDIRLTANIYTNLNNDDIVEVAKMMQGAAGVPHQKVQKGTKKASEN